MTTKRKWTAAVWEIYRQISEPGDPRDPDTSLLARERNRILKTAVWFPIWHDLDRILDAAADEAAFTYDSARGPLAPWFHKVVIWRAKDALHSKFETCPKCAKRQSASQAQPQDSSVEADICLLCNGRGRVLKDLAVNADKPEQVEDAYALESGCHACEDGEVDGQDCQHCGGTGMLLPQTDDVFFVLSPEQQTAVESRLFAELENRLPNWLPRPPDIDFVRDLAGTIRSLSSSNKLQMLLDEQLFAIDNHRTSPDGLRQLAVAVDMKPDAIRTARGRIRARLRSVFQKHGVDVPEALSDRKSTTATTKRTDGVVVKKASPPPRSTVLKNE